MEAFWIDDNIDNLYNCSCDKIFDVSIKKDSSDFFDLVQYNLIIVMKYAFK